MKISKEWLIKHDACLEAVEWVADQPDKDELVLIHAAIKINHFDWASWYVSRKLNRVCKVQYAVFAAKLVLDIFEIKHSNDDRPRSAIKAAEKYIKKPNKKTKRAAYAAAAGAATAAYAADDAAAYAAYAAAAAASSDAAYAAAYAAYDAAYAAAYSYAAAYDAAHAAADENKLKKEIIDYGVKLIKEMP